MYIHLWNQHHNPDPLHFHYLKSFLISFCSSFYLSLHTVYTQINIINWWFGIFVEIGISKAGLGEAIKITMEVFSKMHTYCLFFLSHNFHPRCWDSHVSLFENPDKSAQIHIYGGFARLFLLSSVGRCGNLNS